MAVLFDSDLIIISNRIRFSAITINQIIRLQLFNPYRICNLIQIESRYRKRTNIHNSTLIYSQARRERGPGGPFGPGSRNFEGHHFASAVLLLPYFFNLIVTSRYR